MEVQSFLFVCFKETGSIRHNASVKQKLSVQESQFPNLTDFEHLMVYILSVHKTKV